MAFPLRTPLRPFQPQDRRHLVTVRSSDELAALAAEAQREALARERDALLRQPDEALRARLLKHGFAEQTLPEGRTALLDLLAEANLKARSQVVSYPLRKTPRSPRAIKSFLVAPIDVEDVGFVNFLLDSGSSGALITAELRERLGLSPSDGQVVKGVDSSGLTLRQKVRLPALRLGPQMLNIRDAYVTSLKSDHDIDVVLFHLPSPNPNKTRYPVTSSGGVLGLNFLRMFEFEICQDRQRMSFHPPGHIDKGVLEVEGMAKLNCDVLKGGLLGVPVSLNGSARFPAILDLGANFSILNWPAAELAGVRRGGGEAGEGGSGGSSSSSIEEIASVDGQRGNRIRRGFLDVVLGDEGECWMGSAVCPVEHRPAVWGQPSVGRIPQLIYLCSLCTSLPRVTPPAPPRPPVLLNTTHTCAGSPYVPSRALALMVRDIPSFSALGFGDSPVMVLGYDLLSADRLVLDLRNQRIFVK
ncbi:hypothetical protein VOLCADRAFT_92653 [Volvox carteri f. nagariensis]|uniref:Peptidase A2 domain-containing protein n=1 Tax=Volvox carteri f. nagariensis TaxID=3068 RepID=D8U075_VOLCA|nr:uncharacterized protein VOLCADRAFT_92653 [Volvox carteri f. nagariensis]EFJ46891.1 hypothetical protein VOLCADRAFT_92653 [Volvox carteri f. nagariensis]|eukprot:XP_002952100.1 hypothetical protein VOLCADRAFT_92653 [Volvox carteri f. nagariensis]